MQEAQSRRNDLESNPEEVLKVLQEGAEKAREIASKKMDIVKKSVGIL